MNTKKMEELYGKIANTVNQMIPEEWVKILIDAEIWSKNNDREKIGSTSVGFDYFSEESKKYIFAYAIEDLFEINPDHFEELRKALYEYCEDLWLEFVNQEQEPWSRFTLMVTREGKMKIDFSYEDLQALYDKYSLEEIREQWVEKYLK